MKKIFLSFALCSILALQTFALSHEQVKVDYTIWIGDDVADSQNIILKVPAKTTFFDTMTKAAEIDSVFKFDYKTFTFGRFITSINNQSQNEATNSFWMIYILDKKPNKNHKPSPKELSQVGVDEIIVKDKEYYLFWLQTVDYSH